MSHNNSSLNVRLQVLENYHQDQVNLLRNLVCAREFRRPPNQVRNQIRQQRESNEHFNELLIEARNLLNVLEPYEQRTGRRSIEIVEQFNRFRQIELEFSIINNVNVESQLVQNPIPNLVNQITEREQRTIDREHRRSIQVDNSQLNNQENELFKTTFNCDLNESLSFALNFERFQKRLGIYECLICYEISLSRLTNNICSRCQKYPQFTNADEIDNISNVNPFGPLNNVNPGIVPDELKNLSLIEQILISPIKPIVTVFSLTRNGQYGYNGQIIHFEQNLTDIVTELPHSLNNLSEAIIIRRPNADPSNFSEFRVRKQNVFNALSWLIRNNTCFVNRITINQQNLDLLPYDSSVHDRLQHIDAPEINDQIVENENENENQSNEDLVQVTATFNPPIPNIRDQIDSVLNISQCTQVINFPTTNPQPINELTPGLLTLSYPHLFPTGKFRYL